MNGRNSFRRYLLHPTHALHGWLMLPYGVQQTGGTTCEFLTKHEYALLLDGDGQTEIPYDALPDIAASASRMKADISMSGINL